MLMHFWLDPLVTSHARTGWHVLNTALFAITQLSIFSWCHAIAISRLNPFKCTILPRNQPVLVPMTTALTDFWTTGR